jgi:hypothetical protein
MYLFTYLNICIYARKKRCICMHSTERLILLLQRWCLAVFIYWWYVVYSSVDEMIHSNSTLLMRVVSLTAEERCCTHLRLSVLMCWQEALCTVLIWGWELLEPFEDKRCCNHLTSDEVSCCSNLRMLAVALIWESLVPIWGCELVYSSADERQWTYAMMRGSVLIWR